MHIPVGDYWQLLRRYLVRQRGAALLMAATLLASIGLQLAAPQVARAFLDAARAGASEGWLRRLEAAFLAVALAQGLLRALAGYCGERVAWAATNDLRADLATHLLRLGPDFHGRRTPGELIERVDGDVDALAGFFSSFMVQLVGSGLLLLGVVAAVARVDARLGLAFAGFAALALAALHRVRRAGAPHWRDHRERSAAFYGYLGEALAATEDLRSCGAAPYALRRFHAQLRDWWPIPRRAALWSQTIMTTGIALFAIADALAFGFGGGLYHSGAVSLGTVYLVVAYAAMLAAPIETIRVQLQGLQQADASIARVRELLAVRPALADGTEELPSGALAVAFRAVRFAYEGRPPLAGEGDATVLDGVDFVLEPGHVLGLLGRTGSGKTTIARLLFRLYDPQEGAVCLGDVDLRRVRRPALRGRVGLVTQDVQLFAAPVRDNLTFFDPAVPDARLLAVLADLGLEPWLARQPHGLDTIIDGGRLSAGEAQLVALARIFLKDPGLVILDEASSRLDPATEALLERALDLLLAGRTAIVIAHRLATIERADDILILEDGRVAEYGPRRRLAADPRSRFAALRRAGLGEVLA